MLDVSHEPDLGFIFYPSEISFHYPGHPRLDVILTEHPTERHFDPTKVQYQIASPQNRTEHLTIHHPWSSGNRYRVCAGRIFITDRIGKKVEAFTFGGELQVFSEPQRTICALISPAPILDLCAAHNLPMWLTAEVEILLAEQKAQGASHHDNEVDLHLASVDPLLLYASCLQALRDKNWLLHDEAHGEGPHFVQAEIKRLQQSGAWPLLVPAIEQLL